MYPFGKSLIKRQERVLCNHILSTNMCKLCKLNVIIRDAIKPIRPKTRTFVKFG